MALYLFRRFIYMIMLVWVVSGVSFLIIQLPAGDYVDRLKLEYKARGEETRAGGPGKPEIPIWAG